MRFFFFTFLEVVILNLWSPLCILHLKHILIRASHFLSDWKYHVVGATILESIGQQRIAFHCGSIEISNLEALSWIFAKSAFKEKHIKMPFSVLGLPSVNMILHNKNCQLSKENVESLPPTLCYGVGGACWARFGSDRHKVCRRG